LMAYNFTKKLKALRFCSPYEKICQAWKDDPSPFHANPHLFIVGLNICSVLFCSSLFCFGQAWPPPFFLARRHPSPLYSFILPSHPSSSPLYTEPIQSVGVRLCKDGLPLMITFANFP
ncbi:MAG: hypothetical protein ACK6BL_04060, partial [Holosporaceae bacterium]